MEKKELDAKEALIGTSSGKGTGKAPSLPEQPTEEEMKEAISPELSSDEFFLGDRTFKLRISNIIVQKKMTKAFDAITDLIKKIDILPIVDDFQKKLNRDRKKLVNRVATLTKGKGKKQKIDHENIIREMAAEDEHTYIDMIELIRGVIIHGGISNIVETILDLYVGIVFAICNSQDKTITKEWIEENLNFYDAQDIFFRQMEKDRIGGKVIDFLYVATRQVINED